MTVYKEPTEWVTRKYHFFCPHCGTLNLNFTWNRFQKVSQFKIGHNPMQRIHKTRCDSCMKELYLADSSIIADQEPKEETMEFPATFEEFVDSYKINDTNQVYTNGSDLIPVMRVQQWMEHVSNA